MARINSEPGRELEIYALGVHGALVVGHGLGFEWNRRRGNLGWMVFHGIAGGLSILAVLEHARELRQTSSESDLHSDERYRGGLQFLGEKGRVCEDLVFV